MRDHKNLLSLDIKTYQQKVRNQVGVAAFDVVDIRRVVKGLDAKVAAVATCLYDVRKDVEATEEAISHQILDFRAQAQENYNIITDQLGQLVDYINRGGNDKNGEDSSSRGPKLPPDDQDRPTGEGSANRGAGIRGGVDRNIGGSGSSGSQNRGNMSGPTKRRRSDDESPVRGVRYGPYPPTGVLKRSAEYWCTGKKYF
ncbi:hypothetical protein F511_40171 [Dorcoceras hygrometricum]|uniref:Uncharacterized protein n=1 Tax=Dorcoceras hygrometricum TaxID=472368 RepID=A0A2Z7BX69_9LAMI|nr:hypothetical protein F511_40171 [Dorcoceras hygrometricum]